MPKITVLPQGKARYGQQLKSKNKRDDGIERIGVSVEEAAVMLSLCARSVWVLVKEGKIRHVKYGTRCIISVQSLREFVDGKNETETLLENGDVPPQDENIPQ
jgi:excisionase family DNA binding protein